MWTSQQILETLDECSKSFTFPMLDNGYVYLAATRLSLHRSVVDWALVIEVFGFNPRAGIPDICVTTFGSRLHERDPRQKYVSAEAYENYLANHPHNEYRFFHPIAAGDWEDEESLELVAGGATHVQLRHQELELPDEVQLRAQGIERSEPPRLTICELCRFLAASHRNEVLATPHERRVSVPPELVEVLVLEEWHHPDLASDDRPSRSETFQQLAEVLVTGEVSRYQPTQAANTHWSNWPDGGTL